VCHSDDFLQLNQFQHQNAQSFSDIDSNVLVTDNSASHTGPLFNFTNNTNLAPIHLQHPTSQLTVELGQQGTQVFLFLIV